MKRVIRGSVTSSKTVNDPNYDIQYFQVFSNPKKPTDKGKMIAQAGTFEEAHQKGKKLAGENNYFLKAVCNDGKVRYIDNDYSGPLIAGSSKDATFKTDKRLSPTSERYKGYLIVLDRGGDGYNVYDKHRELEDAGYPSREAAKKFIDELVAADNDIHASSEAVDNSEREFQRIDRSGTDEEYKLAAVMYNLGATLEEAREILPTLSEDKIQEYVDYYNLRHLPRSKRVEIWNNRKNVLSASYGGAFDIEDDQYFTKDEIVEFGNTVCDHLNETFYDTYDVSDVYMETPKKLVLTVVQKSDESEFTATIDIDMRKIKKPADLMNRYLGDVVYALQQDIKAYNDEINASSDITSAQKTGVDEIKTKIWNAASAKMEDMGFPVDEIPDYLFVEVKQADDHIRVEVRAELTYNGLTKLTNELDPIVQSFDKDSYFEPVEPGIAEAYIWNLSKINASTDEDTSEWYVGDSESGHMVKGKKNAEIALRGLKKLGVSDAIMVPAEDESIQSEQVVEAGIYDVPDRPLDPPEDNSWEELDSDDEVIELTLDAIVHIDENGSWEYDDTNYPWAASPDNKRGDWYTNEYSVYIGDKTSIVEYVDELLEPMMPAKEGEYHIKGDVTLVFSVEGIEVKRDYFWDERHGADYDEEAYTDDAETSFLYDKSHIKNFEITER